MSRIVDQNKIRTEHMTPAARMSLCAQLKRDGKSRREIEKLTGLKKSTVNNYLRQAELPGGKRILTSEIGMSEALRGGKRAQSISTRQLASLRASVEQAEKSEEWKSGARDVLLLLLGEKTVPGCDWKPVRRSRRR